MTRQGTFLTSNPDSLATIGSDTVILLVHHARDVRADDDPASSTLHVRVLDEHEPHERSAICDVVLDTPSRAITIGDAEDEVTVTGLTGRTRLVVSAADVRPEGLDELWLDLIVS